MSAAVVLLLAAVLVVIGAGTAGAPGVGADQRADLALAASEQTGVSSRPLHTPLAGR